MFESRMEKRNEVKKQPVGFSKQSEFVRCMEEKARPVFLVIGTIAASLRLEKTTKIIH